VLIFGFTFILVVLFLPGGSCRSASGIRALFKKGASIITKELKLRRKYENEGIKKRDGRELL